MSGFETWRGSENADEARTAIAFIHETIYRGSTLEQEVIDAIIIGIKHLKMWR
jgi:hypothetical protein